MANKFISLENLTYFWGKVKTWVEAKGYETTTGAQGKADQALSDAKSYVDGKGYQTAGEVSAAISSATADFVTGETVDSKISTATEGMVTETTLGEKGYVTGSEVDSKISTATADFVTNSALEGKGYDTATSVDGKISAAKSELQGAIDTAVSSAYKVKGSTAFEELGSVSDAKIGDVWNITNEFTTTEDFVEGAGSEYPAGTNIVRVNYSGSAKWDVLAGVISMEGYLTQDDLQAVTSEEIDGMFA